MPETQDWDGPSVAPFDHSMVRTRQDIRETALEGRERPVWKPAADLPEPDPQPGFVFRWVRISNANQADLRNVARRFGEGWEPVPASDQPRMMKRLGKLGINSDGNIEIGGLMLCRLPEEIREARTAYYANASRMQVQAVDGTYMREQDPRMPKLAPERSTTVSTGPGRN